MFNQYSNMPFPKKVLSRGSQSSELHSLVISIMNNVCNTSVSTWRICGFNVPVDQNDEGENEEKVGDQD